MSAGEAVIEIGKDGEILAMFFERLESVRHLVIATALGGEKGLLVNAVVIGKADHALHRFFGGFHGLRE